MDDFHRDGIPPRRGILQDVHDRRDRRDNTRHPPKQTHPGRSAAELGLSHDILSALSRRSSHPSQWVPITCREALYNLRADDQTAIFHKTRKGWSPLKALNGVPTGEQIIALRRRTTPKRQNHSGAQTAAERFAYDNAVRQVFFHRSLPANACLPPGYQVRHISLREWEEIMANAVPKQPPTRKTAAVDGHGGDIGFARSSATTSTAKSETPSPLNIADSANRSILEEALHTLHLSCLDADGTPAAGYPFTVTLGTGQKINGKLDDNGMSRLDNLTPGTATVLFGKEEPETQAVREEIRSLLDNIIKTEQREALEIEERLAKKSSFGKAIEYELAKGRGAWHAISGFLSFVGEAVDYALPQNKIHRALTAAWETWRYSDEDAYLQGFVARFNDADFKELADVIGFDPRSISREQVAEVKALANFIWEDGETQDMLMAFAKDYIAAQHSLEIVEGGASAVTDVAITMLITALTLGAGGVLIGTSKNLRHAKLLKPLGAKLRKIAEARKIAKGKKKVSTSTNSAVEEQLGSPRNLTKDSGDSATIRGEEIAPDNSTTMRGRISGPNNLGSSRFYTSTDVINLENETLHLSGNKQFAAQNLMDTASEALNFKLSNYVDNVVYTDGKNSFFNVIDGKRIIALSDSTLSKDGYGQLVDAFHEFNHARHSSKLGADAYSNMYFDIPNMARIEMLVEQRALRQADKYFVGVPKSTRTESHNYIDFWKNVSEKYSK